MIYAFDTFYFEGKARTVCIGFPEWSSTEPTLVLQEILDTPDEYVSGHRRESKKPLFITAAGIDLDYAAAGVEQMAGAYRIPDLLKRVDMLSKYAT